VNSANAASDMVIFFFIYCFIACCSARVACPFLCFLKGKKSSSKWLCPLPVSKEILRISSDRVAPGANLCGACRQRSRIPRYFKYSLSRRRNKLGQSTRPVCKPAPERIVHSRLCVCQPSSFALFSCSTLSGFMPLLIQSPHRLKLLAHLSNRSMYG
jgi:hypothetical protein